MNETERIENLDPAGEPIAPPEAKGRKKLPWALISVVIAALSIWAVVSQWKNFSLRAWLDYVSRANPWWLAAAVAGMLGFIVFEGCAIRCACHALHYDVSRLRSVGYAAADIYFSAITPSASGGQPACAWLMMRDGIPGIVATAVLLITLSMYALAILVLGGLCALLRPGVLMGFGTVSKILILAGTALQIGLTAFFLLLIRSEQLLEKICRGALRLLGRLHLLRNEEKHQKKLDATMAEYRRCASLLGGHRQMLVKSFLFNLLQRASTVSVSMSVYMAMGGQLRHALDIFAMQSFVVLGSNCVPIPGAMGVADYLMLDGFGALLHQEQVIGMELLSRSVSFYSCVVLCGIAVLVITSLKRQPVKKWD